MNTKRGSPATKSVKGDVKSSVKGGVKSGIKDKTDWAKLKAMPDSVIKFTKDAPRTSPDDWADAIAHRGLPVPIKKEQIALRVDSDVVGWFRAQGVGWQTRMNAVLKAYRDALARSASATEASGMPSLRRRAG